jgi:hypothetical protein
VATSPTLDSLSPAEFDAFLAELEPDLRAADRDMREVEELEKRGVTAAGALPGKQRAFSDYLASPRSYPLICRTRRLEAKITCTTARAQKGR